MNPGDIADDAGNILITWWKPGQDQRELPQGVGKAEHGRVWVTPEQAGIARKWGWRTVQETTGLVVVERTEAEAHRFLAQAATA